MIEKIDTNKIRGKYAESDMSGKILGAGDDTIDSIKLVAEKLNELIDVVNKLKKAEPTEIHGKGFTAFTDDMYIIDNYYPKKDDSFQCSHVSDGLVYTSNPPQSRCKLCGQFYR